MAFAADSTLALVVQAAKRPTNVLAADDSLARARTSRSRGMCLSVSPAAIQPWAAVEFGVGAQLPTGEPIRDAQFKTELVLPDGTTRPLCLAQGEEMTGSFRDTRRRLHDSE